MTDRVLTPGEITDLTDDVRDHGYAIVQTRMERVPARYRADRCTDPSGCARPPTLLTVAVAAATEEDDGTGLTFARAGGEMVRIPTCDDHRAQATHDLYYVLTRRTRPEGIRAFDMPGQHLGWT